MLYVKDTEAELLCMKHKERLGFNRKESNGKQDGEAGSSRTRWVAYKSKEYSSLNHFKNILPLNCISRNFVKIKEGSEFHARVRDEK